MKEEAKHKAIRRKRARESFPAPLNQIALRHVDTVQSLDGNQKVILAKAMDKVGVDRLTACLMVIKIAGDSIKTDGDLIAALHISEIPDEISTQDNSVKLLGDAQGIEETDMAYLASLLTQCYPDMPQAAAEALVRSEVMAPSLRVVSSVRRALQDAKSDFVITALYMLFEEKLDEIEQVIAKNPAFVKAVQLSRPGWKSN